MLLHGCEGLGTGARLGADGLARDGYVALVVDSFATRGIENSCDRGMPERQADAVGALLYLSKQPFVDPERIGVLGFSQGGLVALQMATNKLHELFDIPEDLGFKASVAYYPPCADASEDLRVPTLILIGELDQWARASDCKRLAERRDGKGAPLRLVVYPEAHHAFDVPKLSGGRLLLGRMLKYDAGAAASSASETRDFLARQLLVGRVPGR